jgi:protein involved in polysaccharide export with SLBB domain
MRAGATGQPLDLSDPLALSALVVKGDVITVTGRVQEYYYIGGKINNPGQKNFQVGISLLQAILAAGGTRENETIVEISREGVEGRLVTTRFNLKSIKSGEIGDPKVQPGDRIQVLK